MRMISSVPVTSACRYIAWAVLLTLAVAGWFGPTRYDASHRVDSSTSAYLEREKKRESHCKSLLEALPDEAVAQKREFNRNIALIRRECRDRDTAATVFASIQNTISVPQDRYCPEYVDNLLDQANACDDKGDYDKARRLYETILAHDRRYLGGQHMTVARDLNNLGLHHFFAAQAYVREQDREYGLAKSCHYLLESSQIYRQFGSNPDTGPLARHNLSVCQRNLKTIIAEAQDSNKARGK